MRTITVEVVYADSQEQIVRTLQVPVGSTVCEAIQYSGLLERFPEIDLTINKVGIFSDLVQLSTLVSGGDRVEIYRPLSADPKVVRRELAALGQVMGGGKPKVEREPNKE